MLPRIRNLLRHASPSLQRHDFPRLARRVAITSAVDQAVYPTKDNAGPDTSFSASSVAITHLRELHIQDFALVDAQRITLQPGFNVITGESGSGKSVLIEALGQLLGSPASEDVIRPPATAAVVEGTVAVAPADQPALRSLLLSLGLPHRSVSRGLDTVTIRREILNGPSGTRSKCSLNGAATSLRVLRELGRALVDVNGQHAAISMKDSSTQLALLDRVAGLSGIAATLDAAWKELQAARAALRSLDELANEEDRTVLQNLVDDVMASGIEPQEDSTLRRRLRQLDSRRDAAERCQLVAVGLGGGGSGGGGMMEALHDVELHVRTVLSQEERLRAAAAAEVGQEAGEEGDWTEGTDGSDEESADALLREAIASLDAARQSLDDAQNAVERYARRYRFSQAEYKEVSERLQEVQKLMKQHDAGSADELLEAAERAAIALDAFYQMEGRREELEADLAGKETAVAQLAVELGSARRDAALRLKIAVMAVLSELAMGDAAFDAKVKWSPASSEKDPGAVQIDEISAQKCGEGSGPYRMRPGGLDSVEFLFAAGPEEPLRTLSSVASGGEAARVMLAIKAAPAFLQRTTNNGVDITSSSSGAYFEKKEGRINSTTANSSTSSTTELGSPIVVLDEIDSGVGSRLGQPIGRILRRMAGGGAAHVAQAQQAQQEGGALAQVLCVSHLPQVAAHAEHHICVRKKVDGDGRVVSKFEILSSREERLDEVAAMLGLPLAAAEELMLAAEQGQ